jgi:hypothetical protein
MFGIRSTRSYLSRDGAALICTPDSRTSDDTARAAVDGLAGRLGL